MLPKPTACDTCKFKSHGTGYVPGEGPQDAKLVLIGEAPGVQEVAAGRPFIGPTGKLLDQLLREVGIDRDEVYITNAVHCARPGFKNPTLPWVRECRKRHLAGELSFRSSPNLIVLLGNAALASLDVTSECSGILKWDGSVFQLPSGHKAMAMIHPAALLTYARMRKRLPVSRKFYRRMAKSASSPLWEDPDGPGNLDATPGLEGLKRFLDEVRHFELPLSVDIEHTRGGLKDCKILCMGLSAKLESGYYSPCFDWNDPGAQQEIGKVLEDPLIPIVTQHGVHDESILWLHGYEIRGRRIDACYLHHTIISELPHSLAFLNSIYTEIPYYKDETKDEETGKSQDFSKVEPLTLRRYCARDAYSTLLHSEALQREAQMKDRLKFYEEIVEPLIPAVADMQATGIRVNPLRRGELRAELENECEALLEEVREAAGDLEFNPNSRPQLAALLFDRWGYKPYKRTPKRGDPQLNEDTFKALLKDQIDDPHHITTIQKMRAYQHKRKELSTFVAPRADVIVESDSRIRAKWSIHGTPTGRLSCKKPNFQNIPEILRSMYVPSDGRIFISADYAAFEQWGIALLAGDAPLLDTLRSGRNPHCQNVADVFGRDYDDVLLCKEQDDPDTVVQYHVMKSYLYGSNYGAQIKTIYDAIQRDLDDPPPLRLIQLAHQMYTAEHPQIVKMRMDIERKLRKDRRLMGAMGRERTLMGHPDEIVTKGYNFPVQNLAADIVNRCHVQLYKLLGRGIICAQVHDSFLFDMPKRMAPVIVGSIVDIMSQTFAFRNWWGERVEQSFPVDVKMGEAWYPMRTWKAEELAA